ncbi:MAG TPA: TetR family transcriptional regulator [Sporosarcina sp.]|nr:TetR family transcriptional regulator [Sporosarcina sp.]
MNKKERIIEAAIDIFRENGIEKTPVSSIVKRAGIAQGTFYLYFSSKLALMPAIAEVMVEKTMAIVEKMVDKDAQFEQKIEQFIDAIFLVAHDYNEIQALIYSGLASTEHLKEWETVYAPFYDWVSNMLMDAAEQELIRSSIHIERTSKLMIGLVESAAEQVYLYDVTDENEVKKQKEEVHRFLLHALGAQ